MSKHLVILFCGLTVVALALLPRTVLVAPQWQVRILDESGQPIVGAYVSETWSHYLYLADHYDASGQMVQTSTPDGLANFAQQEVHTRALVQVGTFVIDRALSVLPHGSGGEHASIFAWADGFGSGQSLWPRSKPNRVQGIVRLRSCASDPKQWGCDLKTREMLRNLYRSKPARLTPTSTAP